MNGNRKYISVRHVQKKSYFRVYNNQNYAYDVRIYKTTSYREPVLNKIKGLIFKTLSNC